MGKKEEAATLLEAIINDRGVPKNVKSCVEEAFRMLQNPDGKKVRVAEAVSILDEIATDPNLSVFTRTVLWDAVSKLEALK